jgi:hypothetical protein
MLNSADVQDWVDAYEEAWRTPGADKLRTLFTEDARYLQSPYAEPIVGIDAISTMWDASRDSSDEIFTMQSEVVAVDGSTAVVRALVLYGNPVIQEYSDLWVIRFDDSGRCTFFEEWPFWPGKHWSADEQSSPPE